MFHTQLHTEVTPATIKLLLDKGAVILDVRTHYEHAGYHVEGAINIPYNELERFRDFILSWKKPVITFSTHGRRSDIAAQRLRKIGVEVYDARTIYLIEECLTGASKE
jgi:rhodanese-related sulfurtransferase